MQSHYDIFISYRHVGGAQYARILQLELEKRGYNVFLDYDENVDGIFGDNIRKAIIEAPIYMIVLSSHCLDRCKNEDDWLRQEMLLAINEKKHFIPVNPDRSFDGIPQEIPQGNQRDGRLSSTFRRELRPNSRRYYRPDGGNQNQALCKTSPTEA